MYKRSLALLVLLILPAKFAFGHDKAVEIDTVPSGAQVEINGSVVCTTPCSIQVDSAYFGRKHTAFTRHWEQPFHVTLAKEGFVPKTVELTTGPIHWSSLNGQNQYDYYLITNLHFTFPLEPIQSFLGDTRAFNGKLSAPADQPNTNASAESLVQQVLPAVVQVQTSEASGSGFFVSPEGIVVTNAHVVGKEASVSIITSAGKLSPWRVLEAITVAAVRHETNAAAILTAILHPEVVMKTIDDALNGSDKVRIPAQVVIHKAMGFVSTDGSPTIADRYEFPEP